MSQLHHGSDAVVFNHFTQEVLDERRQSLIEEMINAYRKGNFDPVFHLSRVAILAEQRILRDAFKRHETQIIHEAEKANDDQG
jgi:hypothetical protein